MAQSTQNTNETNTNGANNTVPPLYENMRVGDKVFPFVTLAGDPSAPVDKREQLEVRTGYERISKLDITKPKPGSNANTRYRAIFTHEGDRYDVYGSVFDDGTNKIAAALRAAYENDTPVIYRIEKYRKYKSKPGTKPYTNDGHIAVDFNGKTDSAPLDMPWADFLGEYSAALGASRMKDSEAEQKYRMFETAVAAVSLDGGKTWVVDDSENDKGFKRNMPKSNMFEDMIVRRNPDLNPEAARALAKREFSTGSAWGAQVPAQEQSEQRVHAVAQGTSPEPKPWFPYTQSGDPNPGSSSITAVASLFNKLMDAGDGVLTPESARLVAEHLYRKIGNMQVFVQRKVGKLNVTGPDANVASHTRIRHSLIDALNYGMASVPENLGELALAEDDAELNEWSTSVMKAAYDQYMWEISVAYPEYEQQ
jgi:hypothetical protein